jgi:protein-tyrosine phosphatase
MSESMEDSYLSLESEFKLTKRKTLGLSLVTLLISLVLVALIAADVVLLLVGSERTIAHLIIAAVLLGEVVLRIFLNGFRNFFLKRFFFDGIFNVLDFFASLIALLLAIFSLHLESVVLVGIRLARLFQLFRSCYKSRQDSQEAARLLVSGNKRRFQEEGFDLDLVYVTPDLIAMSLPGFGRESLYRNDGDEVLRFLNSKHPDSFWVWNLCIETDYDRKHFRGRVSKLPVVDHSVPRLTALFEWTRRAAAFIQNCTDRNTAPVNVVHCRGGKGRTGLFCCAFLIRSLSIPAQSALNHFADRRTDKSKGTKSQGVQVPSQVRYLTYFHQLYLMSERDGKPGAAFKVLQASPAVEFDYFAFGPLDRSVSADIVNGMMNEAPGSWEATHSVHAKELMSDHLLHSHWEFEEEAIEMSAIRLQRDSSKAIGMDESSESMRDNLFQAELVYWPLESSESNWLPPQSEHDCKVEPGPEPLLEKLVVVESGYPGVIWVRGPLRSFKGDLQFRVWFEKNGQRKIVFTCFLHTSFLPKGVLTLRKSELDVLHKDESHTRVPAHFQMKTCVRHVHE